MKKYKVHYMSATWNCNDAKTVCGLSYEKTHIATNDESLSPITCKKCIKKLEADND